MTIHKHIAQEDLHRGLKERHIQLIAIGGAIGVGLFLGANSAIQTAGPALMLSYILGGLAIFFVMRALGEVAVEHPLSGSFSAYAGMFFGPCAGYIAGWSYWFVWILTCMAEITAVGVYCNFWWPEIPQWIPALAAVFCMTMVNLIAVKVYGEFEFWFALIKVVVICALIMIGSYIIFFGINNIPSTGVSNLYALEGGFMPNGIVGVLSALTMVMFAFVGVELVGVTAGEAHNPDKTLPKAINKVMWRIFIFYVGALFVIMSIFPWNEIGKNGSPFVLVFESMGIKTAASIINFVVLTAALSSCSSGIFSTGRMLYSLALQKQAPALFGKTSSNKIPANAIVFSTSIMLIGVALNYFLPEDVFILFTSIATFPEMVIWALIILVQMRLRKNKTEAEIKELKFKTVFYPWGNYIALAVLAMVSVILAIRIDTRPSMIIGPCWFLFLFVAYWFKCKRKCSEGVK